MSCIPHLTLWYLMHKNSINPSILRYFLERYNLFWVFLFGISFWMPAQAKTVRIDSADRLEMRNIEVNGSNQEYLILTGSPVVLAVDSDTLVANRIEFNRSSRILTLIGAGTYTGSSLNMLNGGSSSSGGAIGAGSFGTSSANTSNNSSGQTIRGDNLRFSLEDQGIQGEDVFISTDSLDIIGDQVDRIAGQIKVNGSYFTPCGRCGRSPNDYAFRARQLMIYPGDRLIAYDAQVLIADTPVFYLPFLLMFLNEPARQPKLEFGNSAPDGFTIKLNAPYALGDQAFGTTFLRFYQNRNPWFGVGFDHTAYDLGLVGSKFTWKAMLTPQIVGRSGSPLLDWDLAWAGQYRDINPDFWEQPLDYSIKLKRFDSSGEPLVWRTEASLKSKWLISDLELNYNTLWDLRNPTVNSNTVLKRPEFRINPSNQTDLFGLKNLSLDLDATLGEYNAPTDLSNPSARSKGPISDEFRLLAQSNLSYSLEAWSGSKFSYNNVFKGQYYSTGERAVDWQQSVQLSQSFGVGNTFNSTYNFSRLEGESPFQFDRPFAQRTSETVRFSLDTLPQSWLSMSVQQNIDLRAKSEKNQEPAQFKLQITPVSNALLPIGITYNLTRNFFTDTIDRWSLSSSFNQDAVNIQASTGFDGKTQKLDPLKYSISLTSPDRGNSVALNLEQDLNIAPHPVSTVGYTLTSNTPAKNGEPSVVFNNSETFALKNPKLDGNLSISYDTLVFKNTHSFLLPDNLPDNEPEGIGSMQFSLESSTDSSLNSWSVRYGSSDFSFDQLWGKPALEFAMRSTRPYQQWNANIGLNTPGYITPSWSLSTVGLNGQWQLSDWLGVQGKVNYVRTQSNNGNTVRETLNFSPLSLNFSLGNPDPDVLINLALNQSFIWDSSTNNSYNLQPIIGVIYNRCCWALQAEYNMQNSALKVSLRLPQNKSQELFTLNNSGLNLADIKFGGF